MIKRVSNMIQSWQGQDLSIPKRILIGFMVWLFAILTILFVLTIAFSVPDSKVTSVRQHIAGAADALIQEGTYPAYYVTSGDYAKLDNFTDSIILNVAYDGSTYHNPLEKALANAYYQDKEAGFVESLKYATEQEVETNTNYTRYWFGTAGIVRILMIFFNLWQTRQFIALITISLIGVLLYQICRKVGVKYAVALAFALFLMQIQTIAISLQYAPVMIITLVAMIVICANKKKKNYSKILPYIFVASGTLVALFDLLTYPLFSLGMPLVLCTIIELESSKKIHWRRILYLIVVSSICWILGYALTYLFKWGITSLILQENTFDIAIKQFLYRTDTANEYGMFDVWKLNAANYFHGVALLILGIYTVVWLFIMARRFIKHEINPRSFVALIPFLILASYPFIWYIVFSNHSFIHNWMTYRILAITTFAYLSGTLYYVKKVKAKK